LCHGYYTSTQEVKWLLKPICEKARQKMHVDTTERISVPHSLTVSISGLQDAAHRLATSAAHAGSGPTRKSGPETSNAGRGSTVEPGIQRLTDLVTVSDNPGDYLYTPSYAEDRLTMRQAVHAYTSNVRMTREHS
jgi:hypothetical protein